MDIIYLKPETVISLNYQLIDTHTPHEPKVVLNNGSLESALTRGAMVHYYEQCEDIYRIAAAIGWGLAKAHAFANANKRTAAHVTELFLMLNGYAIEAPEDEAVEVYEGIAKGSVSEAQFADWLRRHGREYDIS